MIKKEPAASISPWTLGLVLLAVLLRLAAGQLNLWYWDEGYVAELSLDLSHFVRPHGGALWWDGFFPLTTTWLAPLTAAPFHWIPGLDPMQAIRLWAALLGGLCTFYVVRLGTRLGSFSTGLFAGFAYAALPLCFRLGAMGLYHALAAALGMAALDQTLNENGKHERRGLYLSGLALASCYWFWILPVSLLLRRWLKGKRPGLVDFALTGGPLALLLTAQFSLGGAQAREDFTAMLVDAQGTFRLNWFVGLQSLVSFPLLPLGILGLTLHPSIRNWLAPATAIFIFEIFRQRNGLRGSSYVFLPVLPWLCLGLAFLGAAMRQRWKLSMVIVTGLLFIAAIPCDLNQLNELSVQPVAARQVASFLAKAAKPGDLVVSQAPINWLLRDLCDTAEPAHFTAYQQWPGLVLSQELPPAAFTRPLVVEKVRYYVSPPLEFQHKIPLYCYAILPLLMEKEGWPMIWEKNGFKIWANPRWPGIPVRHDPVLAKNYLYGHAAMNARHLGLNRLAEFAEIRAKAKATPIAGTKTQSDPAPH